MTVIGYQVERNGTQGLVTIYKLYNPCCTECLSQRHSRFMAKWGLAYDFDAWFKRSPCKGKDFRKPSDLTTIEDGSLFPKHLDTRWLTLGLVLERIVERWDDAKEFFFFLIPPREEKVQEIIAKKQLLTVHCQGIKRRSYNTLFNQISDWCCTTVQHLPTNFSMLGTSCALLAWGNYYITLTNCRVIYQRRSGKWMEN